MEANMKICPSCKEEINKDAKKCPKCQSDLRSWASRHPIIMLIILMFLIVSMVKSMQESGVIPVSEPVVEKVNEKLIEVQKNIKIEGYVEKGSIASNAVLKITNNTGHPIDLFAFTSDIFNNADELQKEQISGKNYFAGQSQNKLAPGKTVTWQWQLSLFPHATKIGNIKVIKVHYSDTNETIE